MLSDEFWKSIFIYKWYLNSQLVYCLNIINSMYYPSFFDMRLFHSEMLFLIDPTILKKSFPVFLFSRIQMLIIGMFSFIWLVCKNNYFNVSLLVYFHLYFRHIWRHTVRLVSYRYMPDRMLLIRETELNICFSLLIVLPAHSYKVTYTVIIINDCIDQS